ncbi:hypothetical protein N752_30225 [Desulforamulus aquiferis]|nr:hypothetical protein [Desulforamulus aquiferis]RYD01275.1 hypothetical protein N752_30225 [Desulforamulus aquiferis]
MLRNLYKPIIEQSFTKPEDIKPPKERAQDVLFLSVDRRSAELAKYTANAFLAMKISLSMKLQMFAIRLGQMLLR